MENARATYKGLMQLRPNLRPFVLTRAAYSGTQRYAASWTGDNSSTWNHLRISLPMLLNLGISGYSFVGADIGGFIGSPTPELLTRWMEVGAFNTIYRNHTAKGSTAQEPWVHGSEHEAIRRRYIEARYRLLPYIYTNVEETKQRCAQVDQGALSRGKKAHSGVLRETVRTESAITSRLLLLPAGVYLRSVRAAATCGSNWLKLEGIPEVSAKLELACY